MELRFSPLFSGSSGNATYIGCDNVHILLDAGVSGSRVTAELQRVGVDPSMLNAILVTHEHSDHIKGIGIISRKYDLPVYATEGTWAGMYSKIGNIPAKNVRFIQPAQDFYVGPIDITPFPIPHDAGQPVGYTFELSGAKLAVATEVGGPRESWMKYIYGAGAVILESNYDPGMLTSGPYPYDLKKRIMGKHGHLSNADAGEIAVELARRGTRQIILAHLSKENNYPALALTTCESMFLDSGLIPQEDAKIIVASREGNIGMFSVTAEFEM